MMWLKPPENPKDLLDKRKRLENLYYIIDRDGNKVKFLLNDAQEKLYNGRWHQMLVLKARQLGVTTFFALSFLDDCFFRQGCSAGIIAHRKEDAEEIFKKKVKFAYDNMPSWTRAWTSAKNDRVGELVFTNGSSYRVSTGFRSGTYQRLLISEFGKICCKSPDISKEIVTGSLNTVSKDQIIAIESTAEGREGYFYDFAREAESLKKKKEKLSPMQQRFFFFPWFDEPSYRESHPGIVVNEETNNYLNTIEEETKRKIDEEQRRWYSMKLKILGESMKQEYPSTPHEAFESANIGLYYGDRIANLRAGGSICRVPHDNSQNVYTAWDIGLHDLQSIWIFQITRGGQINVIDFIEDQDRPAEDYVDILLSRPYRYAAHIFPHDARRRDSGAKKNYIDYVKPILPGKYIILTIGDCKKLVGIQAVRSILGRCVFDEAKCIKGIKHLESYRKIWDDRLGCYKDYPLHDEHSHASDAFRYLAVGLSYIDNISTADFKDDIKAINAYFNKD